MTGQEPLPLVRTVRGDRRRKIRGPQLEHYERPKIAGNRHALWRPGWYLINACLFQGAVLGLIPSAWKAAILRAFGARIGRGLACKPRVSIKYPWFLEIGDHVWLGEAAWIDNHCLVRIGANSCISQKAYLFTGNHDWNDPQFRFFCAPISIGAGCWVGAGVTLGPGTSLPDGTVLAAPVATPIAPPVATHAVSGVSAAPGDLGHRP